MLLKFFIKNVSTGKTVVFTLAALFFTLVFILLFIPSQHYRDIRYFNDDFIKIKLDFCKRTYLGNNNGRLPQK